MHKQLIYTALIILGCSSHSFSQCCGGGGGSPIAGEALQGVLLPYQMEVNVNYQAINTSKFLTGDKPDTNFLENYNSNYLYSRVGLGLSKKVTLSVEAGYWLNKTQIGLNNVDTNTSSGFGDLIVFPRYSIFSRNKSSVQTEITVGMGFKLPLGSYNDSTRYLEPFSGTYYYLQKPLAVQASSGSHDILFSLFVFRGYALKRLYFFANATYMKKGWNPLGEKMGDFAAVSLFAGRSLTPNLKFTLQFRGEWLDKMSLNKDIRMYSYPNYNPEATGFRKAFVSPQISYILKGRYVFYALSDIPVYQKMQLTQIGSQYQFTLGFSYRFLIKDPAKINESDK